MKYEGLGYFRLNEYLRDRIRAKTFFYIILVLLNHKLVEDYFCRHQHQILKKKIKRNLDKGVFFYCPFFTSNCRTK